MNKRFLTILFLLAVLTIGASLWLVHQAATLESKLHSIDKTTQCRRLLELSLPRVQAEAERLISEERAKLGKAPDLSAPFYPMPQGGMADFNRGFFLQAPLDLRPMVPQGQESFQEELGTAGAITNTLRRKADVASAPVHDPSDPVQAIDTRTHAPVFGIYQIRESDPTKPLQLTGDPSPFFSWYYKDWLIHMRQVPTTQGNAAEGFVIDVPTLAAHLLPHVAPELLAPEIGLPRADEVPNLSPLPLVLRSGDKVNLTDSGQRETALRETINAVWAVSLLSIVIIVLLLIFFARMERRRSDFVSAVTHELRTPLTTFSLYTEMLQNGSVPPEKIHDYHETLHRESARLSHLVENVLSFAKLSRGKVRGRQDTGSCTDLLEPVFQRLGERLKQAGFQYTVTRDNRLKLLTLRTDLISVEQILYNLADNAIKYCEKAKCTRQAPAVTISLLQTHRHLHIRFADNGPGMATREQAHLFQPFSRSAKAERDRKPGVGLGLALSRDLARSIGGDLSLERSDEHGCTFLLTLPLGD